MIIPQGNFTVSIPIEVVEEFIKERGVNAGKIELYQELRITQLTYDEVYEYVTIDADLFKREDS